MTKLQRVLRVEIRETVKETVIKQKRHDYARGGFKFEETIRRETIALPAALLECGHWRNEHHCGTNISKAKTLQCFECETRTYAAKRLLEHGPLTRGQFTAITGWPSATCGKVLWRHVAYRIVIVKRDADGQNVWGLK